MMLVRNKNRTARSIGRRMFSNFAHPQIVVPIELLDLTAYYSSSTQTQTIRHIATHVTSRDTQSAPRSLGCLACYDWRKCYISTHLLRLAGRDSTQRQPAATIETGGYVKLSSPGRTTATGPGTSTPRTTNTSTHSLDALNSNSGRFSHLCDGGMWTILELIKVDWNTLVAFLGFWDGARYAHSPESLGKSRRLEKLS